MDSTIQAAMGYFVPIITIISLVWIIIIGVQILCAQYRGRGDDKGLRALFDSAIIFLGVAAVIVSALFFFERAELAWILGAKAHTAIILQDYIADSVFHNAGKVTFKLDDWLKVDDNFGKAPTFERAFSSPEDVPSISADVVNFCKLNNFNPKVSTFAGVAAEELLSNVVIHGVRSKELCTSYIRVTLKDDLNIRIYDDNRAFNPRKEMQKIESEPARPGEEKIGLRLVKSITDRYGAFDYQNTAGINTSIIKLSK